MTYNTSGRRIQTATAGATYVGAQHPNGSNNVVLTAENTTWKGIQHPSGSEWGTVVVAGSVSSRHAKDGSINVIDNGNSTYSPAIR